MEDLGVGVDWGATSLEVACSYMEAVVRRKEMEEMRAALLGMGIALKEMETAFVEASY